jgi:acetyl esterase
MRMAAMGAKVTIKRFLNASHGFIIHCAGEWEEARKLIMNAIRQAGS